MSLPWTAQQCEWLRAMGHAVFVHGAPVLDAADDARAEVTGPAAVSDARAKSPSAPPAPVAAPAVERAKRAPSVAPAGEERAPPPVAAPSAGLRTLHRALLRAAGQRTARAAEALLVELGVDTAAVQCDAVAKRALWVRLRARRRQGSR